MTKSEEGGRSTSATFGSCRHVPDAALAVRVAYLKKVGEAVAERSCLNPQAAVDGEGGVRLIVRRAGGQ